MTTTHLNDTATGTEALFGILGLTIGGFLLLETVALLLDEVAMALLCRILVLGLCAGTYTLKTQSNQEALDAGSVKHIVTRPHNLILLGVAITQLILAGIVGRRTTMQYTLMLILVSLVLLIDESHCLWWLRQREIAYRHYTLPDAGGGGTESRRSLYACVRNFIATTTHTSRHTET